MQLLSCFLFCRKSDYFRPFRRQPLILQSCFHQLDQGCLLLLGITVWGSKTMTWLSACSDNPPDGSAYLALVRPFSLMNGAYTCCCFAGFVLLFSASKMSTSSRNLFTVRRQIRTVPAHSSPSSAHTGI